MGTGSVTIFARLPVFAKTKEMKQVTMFFGWLGFCAFIAWLIVGTPKQDTQSQVITFESAYIDSIYIENVQKWGDTEEGYAAKEALYLFMKDLHGE